ncbi:MAG: hypothetical protein Q7U10_03340 [Thermodesulfovibrionia bacterium]|nr:hypothetical protein [Thermodesulfovibrionia bacterium]
MYDLLDFLSEFYGWLFLKKSRREFTGDEARKAYVFSWIVLVLLAIIIIFLTVSLFISPVSPQKT